jgi:hypothetical protein
MSGHSKSHIGGQMSMYVYIYTIYLYYTYADHRCRLKTQTNESDRTELAQSDRTKVVPI